MREASSSPWCYGHTCEEDSVWPVGGGDERDTYCYCLRGSTPDCSYHLSDCKETVNKLLTQTDTDTHIPPHYNTHTHTHIPPHPIPTHTHTHSHSHTHTDPPCVIKHPPRELC